MNVSAVRATDVVDHYRLGLDPEMSDDNTVRSVCNDDDDVKNSFFLSVLVGIITSVDLLSIVCLLQLH